MIQPYLFSKKIAVISNNSFLQPSYRISPFKTEDIHKNRHFQESKIINDYFEKTFNGKRYVYTSSGRTALNQALSLINLDKKDIVTIFTTTGNFYISSCVTDEIQKYCGWSRIIERKTKAILVNHEFGFPYEKLSELTKYNLPIIEDCAHSFFSQNHEKNVGKTGDYIIYSLPKFFPIQFGGLLVSNTDKKTYKSLSDEEENYIRNVLSHYIVNIDKIKLRRIENYRYLEQQLGKFEFTSRFGLCDAIHCPGVYLFNDTPPHHHHINETEGRSMRLNNLKIFMQSHGVECSVFYKEDVFFLPVHQGLEIDALDYFITLIKYFLEQ